MKRTRIFLSTLLAIPATFAAPRLEVIYSGPAEGIDAANNTVFVLGTPVRLHDARAIQLGQRVVVLGSLGSDGTASLGFAGSDGTYVASGDEVRLMGIVKSVDAKVARIQVGNTDVDFSALVGRKDFSYPSAGSAISVIGIQPMGRGVVVASSLGKVTEGVTAGGINSTGVTAGGISSLGVTAGGITSKGVTAGGISSLGVTAGGITSKGVTAGGISQS